MNDIIEQSEYKYTVHKINAAVVRQPITAVAVIIFIK